MSLPISEPRCCNDDCLIASMCKRNQEMQDILELDGVTVEHFDGPGTGHRCEMFAITDAAANEFMQAYREVIEESAK